MSEKIKPQHLSRKAILYVRQSSPYQVMNNLESQKLQYAMEAHLRSLGWNEVAVIDEDLGRSAGGSVTRTGFERMVTQVCLGEVGAVCAREVSRFARNSRQMWAAAPPGRLRKKIGSRGDRGSYCVRSPTPSMVMHLAASPWADRTRDRSDSSEGSDSRSVSCGP